MARLQRDEASKQANSHYTKFSASPLPAADHSQYYSNIKGDASPSSSDKYYSDVYTYNQ